MIESYDLSQTHGSDIQNNLETRGVQVRGKSADKCQIRGNRAPRVTPADSAHVWVSWNWFWFLRCDTKLQMVVVVDGVEQTIHLTSNRQYDAFIEADPCMKHNIKLKVFSDSEETGVKVYNSNPDRFYSGHLHKTINQRTCLKEDNITVKVLQPFEPLRNCIVTRGDQKFEEIKLTAGLITGEVTLAIINPSNLDSDQSDKINITVPVIGIKRCKNDADEGVDEEGGEEGDEEGDNESRIGLAAAIATPLIILALIIVSLAAAAFFQRKRKQEERTEIERTAVDENPVYGVEVYEEQYENLELRQSTIEVIDSSPYYGESSEEWDGANVADTNAYYGCCLLYTSDAADE